MPERSLKAFSTDNKLMGSIGGRSASAAHSMDIPGYQIDTLVLRNPSSIVYRGHSISGQLFLITTPATATPDERLIACYRRGLELGSTADIRAVLRYLEWVRFGSSVALIAEDFNGVALSSLIPETGMQTGPLIETALTLTMTLGRLHGSGILHQNVNPDNVLVDTGSGDMRLIGLETATRIANQVSPGAMLKLIDGTLAFMSPEQCGRTDSAVGEYSDLYSLGVIFFLLATGKLPFTQQEPAAVAYAHIALSPPKLADERTDIPAVFSEIVDRLLQKNTDARYAGTAGLVYDLQRCATEFQRTGAVRGFSIGTRDIAQAFDIPERIYGREQQRKQVLHALKHAHQGERTLITVSGPSGIGKTAFVHSTGSHVMSHGGRFYSGKFDPFKRDLPYLAIIQAMRSMLRRELSVPEEELRVRRKSLEKALGFHGHLLAPLMPELTWIIGAQPEVDDTGPLDATRRFHGLFARFLGVFATFQSPLVLFLDDFQWADPESLKLLQALAADQALNGLTLVLGLRSNELVYGHPTLNTLAELHETFEWDYRIELPPLERRHITALVADTLRAGTREVRELAGKIHAVAAGNVFFAREYLLALHEHRFFIFDEIEHRWQWDLAALAEQSIPDSLIELMTARLAELPDDCLDLLETASCVGSEFDLRTVAGIHEIRLNEAATLLATAIKKGLIEPAKTMHVTYGSPAYDAPYLRGLGDLVTVGYQFQHDQVRQAVHDRLDSIRRSQRHLHAGRLLVRMLSEEELTSRAVEVFNHLVYCADMAKNDQDCHKFARLGLLAGRSAQRELAFDTARIRLMAAASLLSNDAWTTDYETVLGIHLALAECAYALEDTSEMEAIASRVLQHAKNPVDAVRVHGLRIRVLSSQTRYAEAVDICVQVAGSLGVALSRKPRIVNILLGIMRVRWAQGRRRANEFEQLPENTCPDIRAAIDLLNQSASAVYFAEPNLLPLIGATSTRLSIRHGLSPSSPYGFAVWALVLCGVLGRIENGYDFGKLALSTGRYYGGVEQARAHFVVTTFIRHWKEPLSEVANCLREDWAFNRNAGDEESAVYCAGVLLYTHFFSGSSIDGDLHYNDEIAYIAACDKQHVKDCFLAWAQLYEALRSHELPEELEGDWFDLTEKLPVFERTRNGVQIAITLIAAGILDHLAGRFDRAERRFSKADEWKKHIVSQVLVPGLAFFRALNFYRLFAENPRQRRWLRMARRYRSRIRKWAIFAPCNLSHRVSLLDAEDNLARGHTEEAVMALHRAAGQASHGAELYQALATRRLGEVFAYVGNIEQATDAELRACALFGKWGSPALASKPELGFATAASHPAEITGGFWGGITSIEHMDLQSLLKMVGAISSEIDRGALLDRLMVTLMQAASADRGILLLLDEDGSAVVEADVSVNASAKRPRMLLANFSDLALPVVDLALRTREPVVIDNAGLNELLRNNAYVERSRVQSILSSCIVLQGRTVGLIYLENHVARRAFTRGRVDIIEALAAQAGIALENARLYGQVQNALEYQTGLTAEHAKRLKAEQAAAAKSRFLAAASHDLRQPLHALSLFIDVLREEKCENERKKILPRIDASLEALRTLFEALLDISRLDAKAVTPEYTHFDLADLIRSLADEFRPASHEKSLNLRIRTKSTVVVSDRLLLERVLRNLIGNAIRYTDSGGVLLSLRKRGDRVLVQVWDTGIGIPPEHQARIFDEYQQMNNAHHDCNQGHGLGLAIVKRLCLLLNHPIELRSQPDKGSVFGLRVDRGSRRMMVAKMTIGKVRSWELSGRRILVIDDEPEVLAAMQSLLSKWGCDVIVAESLEEAETQLSRLKTQPELMISDLRLRNNQTGVEALDRLRQRFGVSVPGILVTGETLSEQVRLAQGSGYELLQKPVRPFLLRTAIHHHLSSRTNRALTDQ